MNNNIDRQENAEFPSLVIQYGPMPMLLSEYLANIKIHSWKKKKVANGPNMFAICSELAACAECLTYVMLTLCLLWGASNLF